MKALSSSLLLSVCLWAGGCGAGEAGDAAIPLPTDLPQLEPALAAKIEAEHAAVLAEPESAQRWRSLGMTYEANAIQPLAIRCYLRSLELEDDAKTWSRLGQAYGKNGELEPAADAFRRSIELRGDYAPTHWRLGDVVYDLGAFEEARAAYGRATEVDRKHTGGWIGLARVELQIGDAARACEILEDLLERDPRDADALRLMRTAYIQAGRPEDASRVAASWRRKSSPGKDPWHREFRAYRERPLMEQALADLSEGRPAEAIAILEEFAADNPGDLNVLSYLAWGYYLVEQEGEALATVDRALAKDPNNIPVLRVLARIHEGAGRPSAARETTERIVALDGNDTKALKTAARLQRGDGDHSAAVRTLTRFLELDRGDADAWRWKLDSERALESWEAVATTLQDGLRANVFGDEVRVDLAETLRRLDRWEDAEAALTAAERLDERGRALLDAVRNREGGV